MSIELRMPYPNELYHHGIEGQKWGVQNGPPYPLDPEDHSAAEKKANPSIAAKVGEKRLNKRKKFLAKSIDKGQASLSLEKQIKTTTYGALRRQTNETLENKERVESIGKRTIGQRVAIISAGSIATGASLVAAAALTPVVGIPAAAISTGASILAYHKSTR